MSGLPGTNDRCIRNIFWGVARRQKQHRWQFRDRPKFPALSGCKGPQLATGQNIWPVSAHAPNRFSRSPSHYALQYERMKSPLRMARMKTGLLENPREIDSGCQLGGAITLQKMEDVGQVLQCYHQPGRAAWIPLRDRPVHEPGRFTSCGSEIPSCIANNSPAVDRRPL